MRRPLALLLAGMATLAAMPAGATTYYYCTVTHAYKDQLIFYTPIMATSVDDVDELATGMAYVDEVQDQLNREIPASSGIFQPSCNASSNRAYIEKNWKLLPHAYGTPGREVAFTHPPIPSRPLNDEGPVNGALVVKDTGPTPEQLAKQAAAAQAQAERSRQLAREKADRAAAVAAQQAAYDAKWKPIFEAERARRRKCPSCQ